MQSVKEESERPHKPSEVFEDVTDEVNIWVELNAWNWEIPLVLGEPFIVNNYSLGKGFKRGYWELI